MRALTCTRAHSSRWGQKFTGDHPYLGGIGIKGPFGAAFFLASKGTLHEIDVLLHEDAEKGERAHAD